MYPYGSGMPNQHNQQSANNAPRANNAGFWVPNQSQYPSNNSAPYPSSGSCPYPNNSAPNPNQSAPYPSGNQAPYPGAANQPSSQTPYPGAASQAAYSSAASRPVYPGAASQAPYPGGASQAPYPGGASQAPYPGAASQAPYPGAASQAPYPGAASQASYPGSASQAPYPGAANQAPYPSAANQAPYAGAASQVPYPGAASQAPYPGAASQAPYPGTTSQAPYPGATNQAPYAGVNQQPRTQWNQSQSGYSNSSQSSHQPAGYPAGAYPHNSSSSSYSPSSTSASHSTTQPGYPNMGHQQHGQGYPQNNSNITATRNMAQCFNEMKNQSNSSYQSPIKKGTPTVTADPNFDANKDAHALRKAMKGFGTDEDALINIICRRSNEQRQEIQRQYKTHFGKDLIEDIKSETSGNFENLLVGLLRPIVDFYCTELNSAMAGLGTDEEVLIEILCTLSNSEIHIIKNAYLRMYGAHLESELKSETSGNFKRLLVSLCCAARDESGRVDPVAAQNDAKELLSAGELRVGTDESMFNMVLCQRNYQQLKLILDQYASITGHSLEKAIKREFSGDIQEGLLAICKCVTNKAEYFASRLHKSMAGIGTNDQQLIRVIITRCEIDMHDIKIAFERLYGKSLKSWVKGDTSGHYKHALYALIGEERSS